MPKWLYTPKIKDVLQIGHYAVEGQDPDEIVLKAAPIVRDRIRALMQQEESERLSAAY